MKTETLAEVAAREQPSGRHWVVPGVVQVGARISLTGNAQTLVAMEAAVSAATFTPFMGSRPPWIGGRVLIAGADLYEASLTVRRLLRGRRIDDASELSFVAYRPDVAFWDDLEATAINTKVRLVIADTRIEQGATDVVPRSLASLAQCGVATIVTNRLAGAWATLQTNFDNATLSLSDAGRGDMAVARCGVELEADAITMFPLPEVDLTKFETKVWRAALVLENAITEEIVKHLGYEAKNAKPVLQTLQALAERGALSVVPRFVGGRQVQRWSPILPKLEDADAQ